MSARIFAVEDDELTVAQIRQYVVEMGYEFAGAAPTAAAALVEIREARPDLVLVDIRLEGATDGVELAAQLHADAAPAVIFLTAYASGDVLARAKLTEPLGYLVKPFSKQSLQASIEIALYKSEMEGRQRRIFDGLVQALTEVVKLHDAWLGDVQSRAAELAVAIATGLRLPAGEVRGIRLAAMLHGIGLVGVPAVLLGHNAPLRGAEEALFERHPETAWNLLKGIDFPYPVAQMVYQHMERLDGSGFPRGLSGAAILPGARIVAVASMLARSLTPRGLGAAAGVEEALKELEAGSGTLYDAKVVQACSGLLRDKERLPCSSRS